MYDFQITPWYLRLLGKGKYRRKEYRTYYIFGIIPDTEEKWIYYNTKEI